MLLGYTTTRPVVRLNKESLTLDEAYEIWTSRYEELYPKFANESEIIEEIKDKTPLHQGQRRYAKKKVEKPIVVIPVFPGQNCEFDTKARFERAGAEVHTVVFNNLDVDHVSQSIETLAKEIENAQIFMLVGGFSLGDEPDGSGKFIVSVLHNPKIKAALDTMRANEGLILGICNGFQALVKSGLLPFGDLDKDGKELATLFRNDINRHVSHIATTRITSNNSPWLQEFIPGQVHAVAISHGEGKFMADPALLESLAANGQIATQYVDEEGNPTMDPKHNLNGSMLAIEGILSEDGMILGKMGHSERYEEGLFQNISLDRNQDIFQSGVHFFTHEGKDE
ncbi:MAG: phosphoribosylformylglycinamidine synthase subunit PurQ [Allobaculum sp.]|nr:phosphoribosylformylglycinamidine synthase subunit PurQ [Allobaculum sp.]